MKIHRIELWHVAVPLPSPFQPSWIPGMRQTENSFDLVRLVTRSGIEGWSAAPAMGEERGGLGALLGPYLLGERADDLPGIHQRIREMGYLGWRAGWLEPACWDIAGKAAGKPVWRMLAERAASEGWAPAPPPPGQGLRAKLYASTGEVRTPALRAEEVARRMEEGFGAVKLRVHAPALEEDLALVRGVRQIAGDAAGLLVDANQGWRVAVISDAPRWNAARALAFCRACGDLGYGWVEEPLAFDAYADLAALRRSLGGRPALAGGELNPGGLAELGVMIEKGCYDVVQPDACFTGGLADTWRIARTARRAGIRYSPHTWTNGIGFAINLALFAGTGAWKEERLEYPLDPPGWVPEARDGVLQEPWIAEKGEIAVPEWPGLGFAIDLRALRRHGRRFHLATPARVALRAVRDRGLASARHLGAVRDARLAARSTELDRTLGGGGRAVSDLALEDVA